MNTVVIDANLGISFVLPLPYSMTAIQRMGDWQKRRTEIVVPALWRYEVLSGLRKAVAMGMLAPEKANTAIEELREMAFEEIPLAWERSAQILRWSERIGQIVVYDATYLSLAEQLDAEFWTADKRLAKAAQEASIDWVHFIGVDPESG